MFSEPRKLEEVEVVCQCGSDDDMKPCITMMLPVDDYRTILNGYRLIRILWNFGFLRSCRLRSDRGAEITIAKGVNIKFDPFAIVRIADCGKSTLHQLWCVFLSFVRLLRMFVMVVNFESVPCNHPDNPDCQSKGQSVRGHNLCSSCQMHVENV